MPGVAVGSIVPARAIVVPRGTPTLGGETLPLETHVRALLRRHPIIALVGPPGSGKSTALAHLAAELSDLDVAVYDQPAELFAIAMSGRPSIVARTEPPALTATIDLAPWGESERIDYLLAQHSSQIRSVMERLRACDCIAALDGSPRLWTCVLDAMATRDLPGERVEAFLTERMRSVLAPFTASEQVTFRAALESLAGSGHSSAFPPGLPNDLRHAIYFRIAFVDALVTSIGDAYMTSGWQRLVAPDLIAAVAARIRITPDAPARLFASVGPSRAHRTTIEPALVSVMTSLDAAFRPPSWFRNLDFVYAPRAAWSGVTLDAPSMADARLAGADLRGAHLALANARRADLSGADLTGAMLAQANLGGATLVEASLAEATLRAADLRKAIATLANFNRAELAHAELNSADLRGASFRSATLTRAFLTGAQVEAADFGGATLDGIVALDVDFRDAILDRTHADAANFGRCRFDGMTIDRPNFLRSRFVAADLTGSRLRRATLAHANFQQAGLADVEWEGCDCRGADFTHSAFHMGSSRSGLVGSTIAGEGSRTGFYGHDELEPHKHPEEIRKANLCGADLIGATVTGTSWYLVDLRGAQYTTDQAEWFRACGAILVERT